MEEATPAKGFSYKGAQNVGGILALVGLIAVGSGIGSQTKLVTESYVYGWSLMLALTLGCFGLTLLHHTVRGSWGSAVVRLFEAGGGPIAFFVTFLAWIPIYMQRATIYKWVTDPQTHWFRKVWFNDTQWAIRIVIYFAIWTLMAYLLRKWDLAQDADDQIAYREKRRKLSAPGMVIFFITGTLASTDLFMSLDHHWFSSIFGPWYLIHGALFAIAFGTFCVCANARKSPYNEVVSPQLTKDLGNLTFAICMLWIYFALSQYIITWSGNLPEFIVYYVNRKPLAWLGAINVVFGWFVPWTMLLSPTMKKHPEKLMVVAALVMCTRLVDMAYNFIPFFRTSLVWTDIAAIVGLGGVWLAVFGYQASKAEVLPKHDTRLKEALALSHV